jgi:hypothetical protein
VIVTVAPGTTAPEESVTVPVIVAVVDIWACSAGLVQNTANKKSVAAKTKRRSMDIPLTSIVFGPELSLQQADIFRLLLMRRIQK